MMASSRIRGCLQALEVTQRGNLELSGWTEFGAAFNQAYGRSWVFFQPGNSFITARFQCSR
jgi:hypothetical protein